MARKWIYSNALGNMATIRQRGEKKDKDSVKKDKKTKADNYLDWRKAEQEITPTSYTKEEPVTPAKFSSPTPEQDIAVNPQITNEVPTESYSEADLWSSKDTPTAQKFRSRMPGDSRWERPSGPSTMVTDARYNPNTQQLNLQYRNKDGTPGKIFPYQNVSPEEVESMVFAPSIGQNIVNGNFFKGHGTTKNDEIGDIEEGM